MYGVLLFNVIVLRNHIDFFFTQNLHALGEDGKEVDRPQGKDPAPKTGNTSHNRLDADEDPCWICKIKKDLNIVSILAT